MYCAHAGAPRKYTLSDGRKVNVCKCFIDLSHRDPEAAREQAERLQAEWDAR